jgi:hypothetical protein
VLRKASGSSFAQAGRASIVLVQHCLSKVAPVDNRLLWDKSYLPMRVAALDLGYSWTDSSSHWLS